MKQSIAHDRDDVDIFLITKGRHRLSGEWCGHLAWRERTSSGSRSGKWCVHLTWSEKSSSEI